MNNGDLFDMGRNNMSLERSLFEYWTRIMGKSERAKLTPGRRTKIKDRLKEGYTEEEIRLAIDGCAKSPYHMGDNDRNTAYDSIELICRNGENVERFISYNYKVAHKSTRSKDLSIGEQLTDTSWAN